MGTFITVSVIIVGALFLWIAIDQKRKTTIVVSDDSFSQNGVRVDFTSRTIVIQKQTYSVDKVTGIKTEYDSRTGAIVNIEVDDFVSPVHKVIFRGTIGKNQSREFVQRLSIALRRAGGTSFT